MVAPEEGGEATASVSELWDQKHPISVEEETTREVRCPVPGSTAVVPALRCQLHKSRNGKISKVGEKRKPGARTQACSLSRPQEVEARGRLS